MASVPSDGTPSWWSDPLQEDPEFTGALEGQCRLALDFCAASVTFRGHVVAS